MLNTEIEDKRRLFVEQLEKKHEDRKFRRIENFEKFIGPGVKRKILRLIFSPNIYIEYLFNRLKIYKPGRAKLFWGKEVYLNKGDTDGFYLATAGFLPSETEYRLTKFFIKNLEKADVFYDIGANYGFYTFLALEFCKEVHSFEPLPSVFKYLDKSLGNRSNSYLNNIAVAEKEGEIDFIFSREAPGGSKIEKSESSFYASHISKLKVPTISLDKYIENNNKPNIIKVDIEGSESLFIEGAKNFLKNNSPVIAMEVLPKDRGRDISMVAVEKLKELGYISYLTDKNGELQLIGNLLEFFTRNNIESFENFIFIKQKSAINF